MNITCNILIALCAGLTIIGCVADSPQSDDPPEYTVRMENHIKGYDYPKGVYYEYRFSTYTDQINSEEELNKLYKKGIPVLDAWYRSGSAMCVPPDGKKGQNVIVMPRFIVRLKEKNSNILTCNYAYIEKPIHIFCGYRVTRYHH